MPNVTLLSGRFVDIEESSGALRDRKEFAVAWETSEGKIIDLGPKDQVSQRYPEATLREIKRGFILPGNVDCHIHYPQTKIIGGMGDDLLDWLNKNVWPEESRLKNFEYAKEVASDFLFHLHQVGTTTALVFGSQFLPATDELFRQATEKGMCILTGLTLQDRNTNPALQKSPDILHQECKQLINKWHKKERAFYAVTPRFSPACSDELMEVCRSLIKEFPDVYLQTHINESPSEIAWVAELYPECRDYLDSYEKFGLLGSKTVLAHSVHTTEPELARIASFDCGVAHCPSSNGFLGSGAFPMKRHLAHNIKVGLGTDVGAGISFSLWREAGHSYFMQMRLPLEEREPISGRSMLKQSTVDGAKVLGLTNEIGNFEKNKWMDCTIFSPPDNSYLGRFLKESESNIEQMLFRMGISTEQEMLSETIIRGNTVYKR